MAPQPQPTAELVDPGPRQLVTVAAGEHAKTLCSFMRLVLPANLAIALGVPPQPRPGSCRPSRPAGRGSRGGRPGRLVQRGHVRAVGCPFPRVRNQQTHVAWHEIDGHCSESCRGIWSFYFLNLKRRPKLFFKKNMDGAITIFVGFPFPYFLSDDAFPFRRRIASCSTRIEQCPRFFENYQCPGSCAKFGFTEEKRNNLVS